ncbi:MAG: diacylglyceryl transferase [Flavobacteriales bacterium]
MIDTERTNWMQRLAARWGVGTGRALLILLVFACTGFTVLFLKRPVIAWFFPDGERPIWFSILYYVLILPIYNVFLLIYGALFGQFKFFWAFEQRMFRRLFRRKS